MLVDVHAHLDHERFKDDLDQVILRAKEAGVKVIITAGVNIFSNRRVLQLSEKYDIVKASFGIYPIDALEITSEEIDEEIEWIFKNKDSCLAIGEVGLDYKYGQGKEKEQQRNFQKFIDLAKKIDKPLVIHSRKAELDCIEMLESSSVKKVDMHCFSGNKKLIQRAADNGYSFSIPPVLCRLQHFQMLVEMVNINQLLTETDAPFLGVEAGERNEPAFVLETVKKIASIKGFDVTETMNTIYMNYSRFFL